MIEDRFMRFIGKKQCHTKLKEECVNCAIQVELTVSTERFRKAYGVNAEVFCTELDLR